MTAEYLPGTIRERIQDLVKERKITQGELAEKIGCTDSTLSRFLSGKTDKLSDENIIGIARVFDVSTDFLLGVTNVPDRKNYDVGELGLSVEAAKRLYTGKVNAGVVTLLLENDRFAELTYMLSRYFDDTISAGYAAQNTIFDIVAGAAAGINREAASVIRQEKVPPQRAELTSIQSRFMAAVSEIKKSRESHTEEAQAFTKEIMQKFMTELAKNQDGAALTSLTPEQIVNALTATVATTEELSAEQLETFRESALLLFRKPVNNDGNAEQ